MNHPRWAVTLADLSRPGYEDKGQFDDEQAAIDLATDIVQDYQTSPVWQVRKTADKSHVMSWEFTSLDMTLTLTVEEVD